MFAFEKALVYHCSPTLSGLKPANLLSLSKRDYPHLPELAEDTLSFFLPRGFSWRLSARAASGGCSLFSGPRCSLNSWQTGGPLRCCGSGLSGPGEPAARPGGFALSSEEKALPVRSLPARDRPLSGLSAGGCHRLLPAQGRGLQAVRLLEGLRRRRECKKKLCSVRPLPRASLFPPAVRRSAAGAGRRAALL